VGVAAGAGVSVGLDEAVGLGVGDDVGAGEDLPPPFGRLTTNALTVTEDVDELTTRRESVCVPDRIEVRENKTALARYTLECQLIVLT
jgi:hypothetical protein